MGLVEHSLSFLPESAPKETTRAHSGQKLWSECDPIKKGHECWPRSLERALGTALVMASALDTGPLTFTGPWCCGSRAPCSPILAGILVDHAKCFDRLPHGIMLRLASDSGVSDRLMNLSRSMCVNLRRRFKFCGSVCAAFKAINGILQGRPLSVVLLNVFVSAWARAASAETIASLPPMPRTPAPWGLRTPSAPPGISQWTTAPLPGSS